MVRILACFIVLALVAVSGCSDAVGPQTPAAAAFGRASNGAWQLTMDWGYPVYNECCGTTLIVKGVAHITGNWIDLADGWKYTENLNLQGVSAVGDDGTMYRLADNRHCKQEFTDNGDGTATWVFDLRFIGVGRDGHECSFTITYRELSVWIDGERHSTVTYEVHCD